MNFRCEVHADRIPRRIVPVRLSPLIQVGTVPDHAFGIEKARGKLPIVPWCSHRDRDGAVYAMTTRAKLDSDFERLLGGHSLAYGQTITILKALYIDRTAWKVEFSSACMVGFAVS